MSVTRTSQPNRLTAATGRKGKRRKINELQEDR